MSLQLFPIDGAGSTILIIASERFLWVDGPVFHRKIMYCMIHYLCTVNYICNTVDPIFLQFHIYTITLGWRLAVKGTKDRSRRTSLLP